MAKQSSRLADRGPQWPSGKSAGPLLDRVPDRVQPLGHPGTTVQGKRGTCEGHLANAQPVTILYEVWFIPHTIFDLCKVCGYSGHIKPCLETEYDFVMMKGIVCITKPDWNNKCLS